MTIVRRRGTAIVDTPKGILVCSGRRKIFLLPGGGTERKSKESRRKAAMRELREETGLKAYSSKYLFTYNEGNINLTYNTKKIVEKYLEMKKDKSPLGFLKKIFGI